MSTVRARSSQQGSALIAALFLVVTVGALGVFAIRLQMDQQQSATLRIREYRAAEAARAGLEYWAHRIADNPGTECVTATSLTIELSNYAGFDGFRVDTTCERFDTGAGARVYAVSANAHAGNFGNPDFVRRGATRYMQDSPAVYD